MFESLKKLFKPRGRFIRRASFMDVAFTFRMGGGIPGEVSRGEGKIEPCLIDASSPPTAYGQPVLVNSSGNYVRPFAAGDSGVTTCYGFTVRPYPLQQAAATNYGAVALGAATPPVTGVIDVERSGYIMTQLPAGSSAVVKGGPVYVVIVAAAGYPLGSVAASASAGGSTTIELDATRWTFNGPADANQIVEICNNI